MNDLEIAITWGDLERVIDLVEHGFKARTDKYDVQLAAQLGHLDIIKYFFNKGKISSLGNDYVVNWAAILGNLDIVKYLYENGVNIRADGDYAIQLAAFRGRLDVVKYIVRVVYGHND